MNGFWIRALLVGVLAASPIAVATAQETPPADTQKEVEPAKDDDAAKKNAEEEKEAAPAEQPKAAEEPAPPEEPKAEPADQPTDEPKPAEETETPADQTETPADQAEAPADEAAQPVDQPAETETPPPAPQAPDAPAAGDDTVAAPQLSATAEKPDDAAGKPWRVAANLAFNIGSAAFNKNPDIRKPSAGWLFDVTGAYTITKLLDGNLDVFGRITMDQVLTNTVYESAVGQTRQFEFFFRDVRLGLTAPTLYKEEVTGITISPSTEIFLPTSKASIAAERWFHFGINLRIGKTFEKLGPGDLSLAFGSVFRKPFSRRHPEPDRQIEGEGVDASNICRSLSPEFDQALHTDCGTGTTSNFSFINDFGINYTWGPVTAGISYAIYSIRYHRADLGPDLPGITVGQSPYASDNTWSNLSLGTIAVSYAINDNWTLGLSVATYQNPFWYANGSNSTLRPPFWDPKGENLTTFELGATFVY